MQINKWCAKNRLVDKVDVRKRIGNKKDLKAVLWNGHNVLGDAEEAVTLEHEISNHFHGEKEKHGADR